MRYLVVTEGARGAEVAGLLAQGADVTVACGAARGREAARGPVDVLVLGEALEGRLAHDVALLAEWRNPQVATVLLSDRPADEAEELWDLLPSLQAILGTDAPARLVAAVAQGAAGAPARASRCWDDAEDEAVEAADDEPFPHGPTAPVATVPLQAEPAEDEPFEWPPRGLRSGSRTGSARRLHLA